MRTRFARLFAKLLRSERGVAAIEFAIFAPVLIMILFGGFDVGRYLQYHGKVEKVAFSVSDVTSQYENMSSAALKQVFAITTKSLPNYVAGTDGVTIVTSVYQDKATKKAMVSWQCSSAVTSKWKTTVGAKGKEASVPAGLLVADNDNLIVSEVYYRYKPLFSIFFDKELEMYAKNYFRPRLGALLTSPC